jgi:antirestriction protein ArdC
MNNEANNTSRQDVYSRITSQILASLAEGVRPWVKPWNADHAAGPAAVQLPALFRD